MRTRTTLLLLVVFAALLVYVVRYELPRPTEGEIEAQRRQLLEVDPGYVKYVKLEVGDRVTELARDDTGRWFLHQPVEDRANDTAVVGLLDELTPLSSVTTLDGGRASRITYRLDRPTVVVTIKRPTAAGYVDQVLTVGRKNPAYGAYYAIVDDDTTKTGLIDAGLVDGYLTRDPMSFRNLRLADFAVEDPKTIALGPPGAPIVLERDLGTRRWSIVSPRSLPADQPIVNDLVRRFSTQRIETFVDEEPEDPADYGLDPPAFVLTVVLENELRAGLYIGSAVPDGSGAVYAQRAGRPTVFTIPEGGRQELMRTLFELREKRLVDLPANAVTFLEITRGDSTFAASRQGETWAEARGAGRPLARVPIEQVVQNATVLEARSFVESPVGALRRALDAPLVETTLATDAGDTVRVTFARTGGEVYARLEPSGWLARVDADDPSLMLGLLRTPPWAR
jgi:hypothetical protein